MKGNYNPNVHSALLAAVGGYLLYMAWQLFDKYRNQAGEMSPAMNIIAIAFLGLGGLGTLYYAWSVYRKGKQESTENDEENKTTKID